MKTPKTYNDHIADHWYMSESLVEKIVSELSPILERHKVTLLTIEFRGYPFKCWSKHERTSRKHPFNERVFLEEFEKVMLKYSPRLLRLWSSLLNALNGNLASITFFPNGEQRGIECTLNDPFGENIPFRAGKKEEVYDFPKDYKEMQVWSQRVLQTTVPANTIYFLRRIGNYGQIGKGNQGEGKIGDAIYNYLKDRYTWEEVTELLLIEKEKKANKP